MENCDRWMNHEDPSFISNVGAQISLKIVGAGGEGRVVVVVAFERDDGELVSVEAKRKLEKSMVADNDSGESVASGVHTSSGMFLSKRQVRASVLEIELLARLHHRHLVALKGFCAKKNESVWTLTARIDHSGSRYSLISQKS
ncbi:hypothetical protein YC2023_073344 [Brassica napus]